MVGGTFAAHCINNNFSFLFGWPNSVTDRDYYYHFVITLRSLSAKEPQFPRSRLE